MGNRRGNGEGSIYKRNDGRWTAAITLDAGKRRAFYGRTRHEVASKLATAIRDRGKGLRLVPEQKTLGEFMIHWLEVARPTLRSRTHIRYEQYVRLHVVPSIGRVRVARLTPQHLQQLYSAKLSDGLSPATVAHLHAVLHRALGQALRWGLVANNVAEAVDPPRLVRQQIKALSPEQARSLLRAATGDRLEALYVLALTTGMRQGELFALRWREIELEDGALRVTATLQRTKDGFEFAEPKTDKSRRQIDLAPIAVRALKAHRQRQIVEKLLMGDAWQDHNLVFCNSVGNPLETTHVLRRSLWRLLEKAELPRMRFHDLRHSAATLLLSQGTHPKIVQELLGHSQISVTLDTYSHVLPTLQREAVSMLGTLLAS